jgi:anti-sigma-K factor RskA
MTREELYQSGLLEDYALGLLSEEDKQTVEQYLSDDPEVYKEVIALQNTLEGYAQIRSVQVPSGLKDKVMSEITGNSASPSTGGGAGNLTTRNLLFFVFASIALLALYFSFHYYQAYSKLQEELVACEKESETMYNKTRELGIEYAFLTDQQTRKTLLTGTQLDPSAVAQVFWNPTESKAVIDLSALPPCPKGRTYQLWADVEGEMINMGVLPKDQPSLVEVNFIPNPESFNITIEPEGGSDHPTVANLLANGNT